MALGMPAGMPGSSAFPTGGQLNGPPPSPQSTGMGGPTGAQNPLSMAGLAPPIQPSAGQMPPEVLTGIMQSMQSIFQLLDSYSQVLPDKQQQFDAVKQLLQVILAEVQQVGGGPTSPTATGRGFPAAIDRGVAGAGTVGANG